LLTAPPTDPDVSNSLIRFVSNQRFAFACLGLTRNLPASGAQLGCPGLRKCKSSSAFIELGGCGWRPQSVFRPPTQRTLCPVSPSLRWVHWASFPHHLRRSCSTIGTMLHYDSQLPFSDASLLARVSIPDNYLETAGAPEFPSCPCEHMPRSKTPMVSCTLAMACAGLLPSAGCIALALGTQYIAPYPLTTTIPFSGFNYAACVLAPSSSGLPLRDLPEEFATDLLAGLWSDGTCPS